MEDTCERRKIEISPLVIKDLKEHKAEPSKKKVATGECYKEYNLVCALDMGNPIHPVTLAGLFYDRTRKAKINIRFHDLRHCHATSLLKGNEKHKMVAECLGHSSD